MADIITDPFRAARLILSLRREGVTDNTVLSVMERVERDRFVKPEHRELAMEDSVLPIPCGQTMPRPSQIGHLLQLADFGSDRTHRALLVGLGSGYMAALMAELCASVFAIERYRRLVELGQAALDGEEAENVYCRQGDGLEGWPEKAPFTRIVLSGSVNAPPVALLSQLDTEGRLIAPIETGGAGQVQVFDGTGKVLNSLSLSGFQPLSAGVAAAL